ncbi:MAG: DMT family transporter [candidate division Zixibacteria bacterium]|nr:DMT family transporter [candidate division Zixibacteria bacterium]
MNQGKYKNILANSGLFYSAVIWGSTFFIVKNALSYIHPVILVGYRFTLAAVFLGIVMIFQKKKLFRDFSKGLVLGILIAILYLSQTIGLGITTASNSGFITGMFVAFVPLFSYLIIRKKPTLQGIIASGFSLCGLWILTGGLKSVNTGDLMTLITAVTYAVHILFADKYIKKGVDPYIISFQQFFVVGVISFIAGAVFRLPFEIVNLDIFSVILFLTLFPTLSAFVIQVVAQKIVSPVRVSLIFALEPLFAAIFAWTLGNEAFVTYRALGGFLIVIALVFSAIPIKAIYKKGSLP